MRFKKQNKDISFLCWFYWSSFFIAREAANNWDCPRIYTLFILQKILRIHYKCRKSGTKFTNRKVELLTKYYIYTWKYCSLQMETDHVKFARSFVYLLLWALDWPTWSYNMTSRFTRFNNSQFVLLVKYTRNSIYIIPLILKNLH